MEQEEPLYVGVVDPVDLRKDLLNSSKIILGSLKRYELYIDIKKDKEQHISELKKVIREIHLMSSRLKQVMPKTSAKPKQSSAEEKAQPKQRMVMPAPSMMQEKTRLAELEDELANVEEKLRRME